MVPIIILHHNDLDSLKKCITSIKKETKTNPQRMTNINLIYSDELGELTIPKIITNFSTYDSKDKRMGPVFQI